MTRRGWIAIALAVVVNASVVSVAFALDSTGSDVGAAAPVHGVRSSRTAPGPSTTTTTRADRLALPPAPPATPIATPVSAAGTPVVSRVPTTDKVVFVTIDDGIVRDPAAIDTLRRMRIPVSMFLVRDEAIAGQSYFQQLVDLGGLVEAHTTKHPNLKTLGWSGQQTEICGPLDTLQRLFVRRPVLFRPPGGAYNATTQSIAKSCGFRYVVLWTAAANDGRIDFQAKTMQPGDIILFHFRRDLVQNLELLGQLCKQQGYTVARLEDYLVPG